MPTREDLARKFGGVPVDGGVDTAGPARKFGGVPMAEPKAETAKKDTSSPASMALEAVKGGVWDTLTGVASLAGNMMTHPVDTVGNIAKGIARGHMNEAGQAFEAAKQGDVVSALGHGLYAAMPVIGPAMSQTNAVAFAPTKTGDERARALGQTAAALVPMPKVARMLPEKIRLGMRQNPAIKELKDFAEQRGVPMDAASSTDNMFVRGAQQVSGSTLGGSVPAAKGRTAQADALRRVSGELADETGATATAPVEAGRMVARALEEKKTMRGDIAGDAYGELHQIESLPNVQRRVANVVGNEVQMQTMAIPVDVTGMKAWARPILETLQQRWNPADPDTAKILGQQIKSLTSIVDGPNFKPASVAEKDLGAIKALVRNSENSTEATLRGGDALTRLQSTIDSAVADVGGRAALDALKRGRENWAKRAELDELQRELSAEPVKAVMSLTERGDRSIEKLKRVAEVVPEQVPQIGRAFVQEMFDKAMDEGGFKGGQGMMAKWENLGPETKSMLFPDATHRADLDKFFKLSARISRVPNTSGTAGAMAASGSMGAFGAAASGGSILPFIATEIGSYGLSKAMHNPRFVRMLNQGLTLPARSSAQKLVVGKLIDMARKQGEEK